MLAVGNVGLCHVQRSHNAQEGDDQGLQLVHLAEVDDRRQRQCEKLEPHQPPLVLQAQAEAITNLAGNVSGQHNPGVLSGRVMDLSKHPLALGQPDLAAPVLACLSRQPARLPSLGCCRQARPTSSLLFQPASPPVRPWRLQGLLQLRCSCRSD